MLSCGPDDSEEKALIIRQTGSASDSGRSTSGGTGERQLPPVQIPIADTFRILDVQGLNLDRDSDEEQLILVMNRDNLSSPLSVIVADYDVARKTYFKTWEAQTLARANEPYSLSVEDLIGDHSLVIVLEGLDEKSNQTINLYRLEEERTSGNGLSLSPILELTAPGSLTILRGTRSQAYDLGQKNEESFPVISETTPSDSSSILEIKRDIYEWRFQENRYVLSRTETALQDLKSDSALAEILKKNDEDFLKFLSGPWYFTGSADAQVRPTSNEYLSFDLQDKIFSFFAGGTMEQYNLTRATRTTRSSMRITGTNNLVGLNLVMSLAVNIISPDTLSVEIQGSSSWNSGIYGKLPTSTQRILLNNRDGGNFQRKGLSGLFRNEHGQEINFDLPFFTRVTPEGKTSGSASIFELSGSIIQLKTLDENGQSLAVENYLYTLDEERRDLRTIRTLKLYPGKLTINGFEPFNQDFIKLEQTEVTSSSE